MERLILYGFGVGLLGIFGYFSGNCELGIEFVSRHHVPMLGLVWGLTGGGGGYLTHLVTGGCQRTETPTTPCTLVAFDRSVGCL